MNSRRPSSQSLASPERNTSGSETTAPNGEVPHVKMPWVTRLANWMAPTLILLTPLVGFLRYHHYDILRAETLSCVGLVILVGLAISAFVELRPGLLRPAVIGLLLFLFLDLHLRSAEQVWVAQFARWDLAWAHKLMVLTAGLLVIALVFMTVTWLFRQHLGTIVSSIFGVIVLASLLLPFATFYAIVSHMLGSNLAVFLVTAITYGFTTAAMMIPALAEFDFAMGRESATDE